jgi:hypothetical protein
MARRKMLLHFRQASHPWRAGKMLLHFRHASHPWLAKESRITAAWESKHERG